MKLLILALKKNEGDNLASGLERFGHTVKCDGISIRKTSVIEKLWYVLLFLFRNRKMQYDVIILESVTFDVILALFYFHNRKIPYIIYSKGYFPQEFQNFNNRIMGRLLYELNKYSYEQAAGIIFVSKWLQDKYRKESHLNLDSRRQYIVHHSIDGIFFDRSGGASSCSPGQICYTSDFYFYEKAAGGLLILDAISEIAKTYKSIELLVIGDGRYRYLLEEKAKQLKLQNNVRFLGRITKNELKSYYESSCLFVYCSFLDACPTVIMEAQACGTPVLTTSGSGAVELLQPNATGIICDASREELTKNILYLIKNPDLREKMSENARIYAKDTFVWSITAQNINEILTLFQKKSDSQKIVVF
jgi:glycosyltransferase involved in cell wall biosynthesis